jgi:hypothetical protein
MLLRDFSFWSGEGYYKSCAGDWQRTLRRLGKIAGVHIHPHRTYVRDDVALTWYPGVEVAAILGNSPRIIEKHYSQWIQGWQESINAAVKSTW